MPQQPTTLAEALSTYDREGDHDFITAAEAERQKILALFPMDSWPALPLERYALGQDGPANTYCKLLEYDSQHLGSMRGGFARKLIIYKHKHKPGWYFPATFTDVQSAWDELRSAFVKAIELGAKGQWEDFDDVAGLSGGPALMLKTLHVYFPDEIVPIYAQPHLRHFLRALDVPAADDRSLSALRLNRALVGAITSRSEFIGWTLTDVSRFFYQWNHPHQQRRVVKIAPGENAEFWPECRDGGYVCVGWGDVGDLREFESKEAYRAAFEKAFFETYKGHRATISKKANEVWSLLDLEPGDIVIANKGVSRVVGIGEVVEPGYEFDGTRSKYPHLVRVSWTDTAEREIPPQKGWPFVTIAPVSSALYETIVSGALPPQPPAPIDRVLIQIEEALERKGQTILYGPPGTGKTYHARRLAVSWLLKAAGRGDEVPAILADGKRFATEEAALQEPVDKHDSIGLLTQLTFHPSYSYEDFVEGFRPQSTGDGQLSLRLTDGVFKRVCRKALEHPRKRFLVSIDEINRANVAKVFGELITLLEVDKRGMRITLPQSRDAFRVPPNVFLLGTMNTADRSIKLLDAALRRRFAFIELMPDSDVLRGATIRTLALDDFLEALNGRIAKSEGREKQIGHAFLLDRGEPVTDPEEFARRFRQEVLPLLQEYCYDDYSTLVDYLGAGLVDKDAQLLRHDVLNNADALLGALEDEFGAGRPEGL